MRRQSLVTWREADWSAQMQKARPDRSDVSFAKQNQARDHKCANSSRRRYIFQEVDLHRGGAGSVDERQKIELSSGLNHPSVQLITKNGDGEQGKVGISSIISLPLRNGNSILFSDASIFGPLVQKAKCKRQKASVSDEKVSLMTCWICATI